jgi:hypothetical protein
LGKFKRLIERKSVPIPKISIMLQELVKISHATALDLNMGYFTIRLDKDASKICTIIFSLGQFYSHKKRCMMVTAGSPTFYKECWS